MTEIITRPQADLLLNAVLVLGLVLAVVGALTASRRKTSLVWGAIAWGGPLVLAWALWRLYNGITDRLGLDSVLNLVVNAVLFIIVGMVCGFVWARFGARNNAALEGGEAEQAAK